MNEKFQKLIDKKKKSGETLSPVESAAKGSVLNDLRGRASKEMSGKLSGLKKVTVASPSKEGLEHGLEKAHQMVDEAGHDELPGEEAHEDEHSPQEALHSALGGDSAGGELEEKAPEEMSPEELDEHIAKLHELRKSKHAIHRPY